MSSSLMGFLVKQEIDKQAGVMPQGRSALTWRHLLVYPITLLTPQKVL